MLYTKRKLHKLRMSTTTTTQSSTEIESSPQVMHIPKIPTEGWGTSLSNSPFFSRVEVDRHISKSGKERGSGSHHTLPTELIRAKTYLKDEYLHEIEATHDQRYFYFRAKCFHSFKKNESPHSLKLALCIVSGEVVYAYCGPSCAAGKSGFCNHMLALMLKVCKFSLYICQNVTDLCEEDDENPSSSCTSTLQKWHQPRSEGISSQPVMEVVVTKTHQDDKKTAGVQCKLYEARKEQTSNVPQLLETIKEIDPTFGLVQTCEVVDSPVMVSTIFGESPAGSFGSYQLSFYESNFTVSSTIEALSSSQTSSLSAYPSIPLNDFNGNFVLLIPHDLDGSKKELLAGLQISLIDANKLEQETKLQYRSEVWKQARKLRFTASKFGRIVRRKKNFGKFFQDLLKPFKSRATEHGIKYEPVARIEYQKYMERIGHPVRVIDSGFFVSPKLYILGCSPDGKVIETSSKSEDKFGLLEVKCPSSKFEVTPTDACSDSQFYLEMQGDIAMLKKDHEYYDQVQGQMGLTGAKWCNFVVYTKAGMNIQRIKFDEEHWQQLREKLCSVYFTHFLSVVDKLDI